ncbi:protein of unknown function [Luteibacter sp. UNC138MFCol5.1]|uniref:DUF3883 domain-containing protein n=1 Tax=Luteibacter sp. UNC138MFCol5.1 TaxID=1502774 RepID=UPI0008D40017|nr:DUF3883 domain-containing protein [Luteibacter sp. UNC138MFCol5.1]SEP09077.1 protein of unknown function [Luteibacter sp. UNC138MFCol5.1]
MSVFIIPAANSAAQKNYGKTLLAPISRERLELLSSDRLVSTDELYAWGFPRNHKNLVLRERMSPGDICFFYMKVKGASGYLLAARVLQVVPESEAVVTSQALWDSPNFLPYYLARPLRIAVSTNVLASSLSKDGDYLASHPQSSMVLGDEMRAAAALSQYGSFDEWAVDFLERYALDVALGEVDGYFSAQVRSSDIPIPYANDLFMPPKSRRTTSVRSSLQPAPRWSKRSKLIGDAGEAAVFAHLIATLDPKLASTVRWVASEGETPGWDIEYRDARGELVRVEVKSTTGDKFVSFEITANELAAAKSYGAQYHLYLVANCLSLNRRKLQVFMDPSKIFDGMFLPSVYRVGF